MGGRADGTRIAPDPSCALPLLPCLKAGRPRWPRTITYSQSTWQAEGIKCWLKPLLYQHSCFVIDFPSLARKPQESDLIYLTCAASAVVSPELAQSVVPINIWRGRNPRPTPTRQVPGVQQGAVCTQRALSHDVSGRSSTRLPPGTGPGGRLVCTGSLWGGGPRGST